MKAIGGTTRAAIQSLLPVNLLDIIKLSQRPSIGGVGRSVEERPHESIGGEGGSPACSRTVRNVTGQTVLSLAVTPGHFLNGAYQAARPSVIDLPTSAGVACPFSIFETPAWIRFEPVGSP